MKHSVAVLAGALLLLSACGLLPDKVDPTKDWSATRLYREAKDELNSGNYEQAIKYFEMAIQIKKDWSKPYWKLGLVYLNKGDMAKATENLEKVIKLEPDTERTAQAKNILGTIQK